MAERFYICALYLVELNTKFIILSLSLSDNHRDTFQLDFVLSLHTCQAEKIDAEMLAARGNHSIVINSSGQ